MKAGRFASVLERPIRRFGRIQARPPDLTIGGSRPVERSVTFMPRKPPSTMEFPSGSKSDRNEPRLRKRRPKPYGFLSRDEKAKRDLLNSFSATKVPFVTSIEARIGSQDCQSTGTPRRWMAPRSRLGALQPVTALSTACPPSWNRFLRRFRTGGANQSLAPRLRRLIPLPSVGQESPPTTASFPDAPKDIRHGCRRLAPYCPGHGPTAARSRPG